MLAAATTGAAAMMRSSYPNAYIVVVPPPLAPVMPTFLASIWGMNFEHMPELTEGWGYPLALALMAIAVIGLYRFFKRINWL